MTMFVCLLLSIMISYFCSQYIKKYSIYIYIFTSIVSITCMVHSILMLNNYSITYIPVLKQIMKAIDSGALGGSIFILVMYMGAMNMKFDISKKLRMNRAELSIIASIITIPHNVHYFFAYLLGKMNLSNYQGLPLWANLMMFASACFAIIIMIPLFITSFRYFRKKMNAKAWKNLQEYAYIFYAMLFVQVIMVYLSRPMSLLNCFNILMYVLIFISYSVLKMKMILNKNRNKISIGVQTRA